MQPELHSIRATKRAMAGCSQETGQQLDGWLAKKSRNEAGQRMWHRRWFVLDGDGLSWFVDETRCKARGSIPLLSFLAIEPVPAKGPGRFVLRCVRDGTEHGFDFEAESLPQMQGWCEMIVRSLDLAQRQLLPRARTSLQRLQSQSRLFKMRDAAVDAPMCGEVVEARLTAIAGNQRCADCCATDRGEPVVPSWASSNLGTLFCIRCSGVHRKLGAHVSKVLSIKIDSWSEAQLQRMEALGNEVVNRELEAALPAGVKPDSSACSAADLEAFIRAKYELGSFCAGGDGQLPAIGRANSFAGGSIEFVGLLFVKLISASNLPGGKTGPCPRSNPCRGSRGLHRSAPHLPRSQTRTSSCRSATARASRRRASTRPTRAGARCSRSTQSRWKRRSSSACTSRTCLAAPPRWGRRCWRWASSRTTGSPWGSTSRCSR